MFVVWNPEDAATDLNLKVGLTLARALCIRAERDRKASAADFEAIDKAILEIEKQTQYLTEVTKSADTIKTGAEKILDRVRKSRNSLERQVETLQEHIAELKQTASGPATD